MHYGDRMYPPPSEPYSRPLPQPPRLHWGIVLALNVVTLGIFDLAWIIVQTNWVRKVRGRSTAFIWAIAYASLLPAIFLFFFAVGFAYAMAGREFQAPVLEGLIRLIFLGVRLAAVYTLRDELQQEPINISTGGIMTFFFGTTYFQYHLHDFYFDGAGNSRQDDGTLGLILR